MALCFVFINRLLLEERRNNIAPFFLNLFSRHRGYCDSTVVAAVDVSARVVQSLSVTGDRLSLCSGVVNTGNYCERINACRAPRHLNQRRRLFGASDWIIRGQSLTDPHK